MIQNRFQIDARMVLQRHELGSAFRQEVLQMVVTTRSEASRSHSRCPRLQNHVLIPMRMSSIELESSPIRLCVPSGCESTIGIFLRLNRRCQTQIQIDVVFAHDHLSSLSPEEGAPVNHSPQPHPALEPDGSELA